MIDAMTIEQMLIVSLCAIVAVPIVLWWAWRMLVEFVTWAAPDRRTFQHTDHVAARKRTISRNGFKSRIGAWERRCR